MRLHRRLLPPFVWVTTFSYRELLIQHQVDEIWKYNCQNGGQDYQQDSYRNGRPWETKTMNHTVVNESQKNSKNIFFFRL